MNILKDTRSILLIGVILIGVAFTGWLYTNFSTSYPTSVDVRLMHTDITAVSKGKLVYEQNCASCHGKNLEGQANWRQRDTDGYLPAPPHSVEGHTWHHPDEYLFTMTKYGIEKIIGKTYPNNMPIYEGILSDYDIIAVLSYIKSTWPEHIQFQHDRINSRARAVN